MQFQNFKCSLHAFYIFKIIFDLISLILLVHLITDVILQLMSMMQLCTNYQMNPQNF